MYENLAIMAVFVFVYSSVAGAVEKRPMSGPIVFMAFGVLAGPMVLGLMESKITAEMLRGFAELSLALVLFTDAANADITTLRRSFGLPERMLLIGLPITIVLGFLVGLLFFPHLPLLQVALIAVMLAPTDAALGKGIFANPKVPVRIREALNVESGLNDGICVPILYLFLALAVSTEIQAGPMSLALTLLARGDRHRAGRGPGGHRPGGVGPQTEHGAPLGAGKLAAGAGGGPGLCLLRHGPEPGGQRLHRLLRGRPTL